MNDPTSFSTMREIGLPACEASSMPMMPPMEVPNQCRGVAVTHRAGDQRSHVVHVLHVVVVALDGQPPGLAAPDHVRANHAIAVRQGCARVSKSRPQRA